METTRNSRVVEDLVDQLFNSSEKRLARTLLLLTNFGGGRWSAADPDTDQPGDAGGNHRHDAFARKFLHEQIQEAGLYRLQRPPEGSQLVVSVLLRE
jgi:hypothetical protein